MQHATEWIECRYVSPLHREFINRTNAPTAMHVPNTIQYKYCIHIFLFVGLSCAQGTYSFDKNLYGVRAYTTKRTNKTPPLFIYLFFFFFIIFVSHGIEQTAKRIIGGGRFELYIAMPEIERITIESRVLHLFRLFLIIRLFSLLSLFNSFQCLTACNR